MATIRKFRAGATQISAAHLNQLVAAVNQFNNLLGDGLIEAVRTPGGTNLKINLQNLSSKISRPAQIKWGKIKAAPVVGAPDYVDVYECDNKTADNVGTNVVRVYLPETGFTVGLQSLLKVDDVIGYMYDEHRDAVCVTNYTGKFGGASQMFPVKCYQIGGDAGGPATQCSFTYTATTCDTSTILGNGLTPSKNRPVQGVMDPCAAGDYGLGFYDCAGAFVLYDANETLASEACP